LEETSIIHRGRPAIATDYGPGVGWPEDCTTVHWLENRGSVLAREISVDIVVNDWACEHRVNTASCPRRTDPLIDRH
jgi:hypothetical protein